MDTSKEYIEMCKKAQEIQNYRQTMGLPSKSFISYKGDWFCHVGGVILVANQDIYQKPGTWLPRQDQLQELLIGEDSSYSNRRDDMMMDFYDFWGKIRGNEDFDYCDKYERFWLAFVMEKEYNKHWDNEGKCWSKEDEIWNNKNKK
jgi:hypothetical protein